MQPHIYQLIRDGLVDDVLGYLHNKLPTRKDFLDHIGSYLHKFIGLTARQGSIEILQRCIEYGVELKIDNEYGLHALVGAANQGHDHIIKWLVNPWIENGRQIKGQKHFDKVNLPQDWLFPPLHEAVRSQHTSTVKLLLQKAWAVFPIYAGIEATPQQQQGSAQKTRLSIRIVRGFFPIDLHRAFDNIHITALEIPAAINKSKNEIDKFIRMTEERNEIDKDNSILVATKLTSVKSWFEAYDKQQYFKDGCLCIKDPLQNLDTKQLESAEAFLEPQSHITIMHLAACSGKLEPLKRADELKVDLYVGDMYGRSALHYAAAGGQIKVVRWFLRHSNDHDKLSNQDEDGKTPLHLAVEKKHVKVVKLLVDAKVDLNAGDNKECTPIHLASENVSQDEPNSISDYEKIVEILTFSQDFIRLTDNPWAKNSRSILNEAVKIDSIKALKLLLDRGLEIKDPVPEPPTTPWHIAAAAGSYNIMDRLRKHFSGTINMENVIGQTPLHIAVIRQYSKCAKALINNGGSLTSVNKDRITVIEFLFQKNKRPVDFLTNILDGRITSVKVEIEPVNDEIEPVNDEIESVKDKEKESVALNFKDLIPEVYRDMTVVSALKSAASMKQMKILAHPLVEAFLEIKWMHFRRFSHMHLIFHIIFAAYLSLYVILLQFGLDNSSTRWLFLIPLVISMVYSDGIVPLKCDKLPDKLQCVIVPKYHWKQCEFWLSFICAITYIVVPVAGIFGQTHSWVLAFISTALIAAYIQMMLSIGIFMSWEYYGLMFKTVLRRVFKVLLALGCIIVGFAFSLSTLFYNDDELRRPWTAFPKTVVMMTGEYDYNNLFDRFDNNNSTVINTDSNTNQNIFLAITTRIILLIFVIFASIVLMNLITALAIVDVQELLNEVHIRHLMKRIETLSNLELKCQKDSVFKCLKKKLNIQENIGPKPQYLASSIHCMQKRGISKKLAEKLIDHISKSGCHYNRDSSRSDKTENRLTAIEASLERMELSITTGVEKLLRKIEQSEDRLMAIEASLEIIKQSAQDPNIKRKHRSV